MATYSLLSNEVSAFNLSHPTVSGSSSIAWTPDTSITTWPLSSFSAFDYFPASGGGGGDTRPTSGFLYPRGQS